MASEEQQERSKDLEIWLLVDHSAREASLIPVAEQLEDQGYGVELVTITEVIGNVAREALAGGAERLLRGLRVASRGRTGDEDLVGAIRRRQPDMLVVTEARHARAIGVLENLTDVESLQVGLVSEFFVDPAWFNGQLHAFVVPDDETRADIIDRGISEQRVKKAGPALRPEFHRTIDSDEAREQLGFDDDQVVLVRADGFNRSTLEQIVFQCNLCDRDVRYIFHHDSDGAAASTLRRAADEYGLSAAMFGRVADLERYFGAADAILASETDAYLPELLQSKTPSLLVEAVTDAKGNGAPLADRGLVDYVDDIGQLGTRLDRSLEPERLEELAEALEEWDGIGRHEALAPTLEEIADHGVEWRYPARPEESEQPESETLDDEQEAAADGPFETIGRSTAGEPQQGVDGRSPDDEGTEPRQSYSNLSKAEAREQLAELILKERKAERRLQELEKQQERWRDRLQLAREWNEDDLVDEAKSILRGYVEEADPVEQKLQDIRRQKQKLKRAARSGDGADFDGSGQFEDRVGKLEERFRKMEVDDDLEGLKDRIRRELGE